MEHPPFKLALRQEGSWWVAYIAVHGETKSVEMSRIRMIVAEESPAIKAKFIELNQLAVEQGMKAIGHEIGGWSEPVTAPESERSGHG